ncbi:MAG: NADH-quinone oxidoreductase subunit C, partial [Coriobacteriaceae bacterium]|nr:NADH-quinone oxidoreductase subunit C [Coriobacteriaceae bacterium]
MSLNVSFLPLAVKDLPSCARSRKDEGWRLVQMLCVRTEKGTDLIYSFMKDDALENYTIKDVKGGMEIPSISESFLNAFVFENEAHDLFGVQVTDIAIDFAGKFYAVSQSEPMTVISPAQKEAREKAAKIAAAKAAKEAKGATGGSTPEAAK